MLKNPVSLNLKNKLDEIDKKIYSEVYDGFYQSRLRVLLGIWEKGEMICDFRGVNPQTNWFQLEKMTGRNHESLKSWYDLYKKYPEKDKYLTIAEERAKRWTDKIFNDKLKSKPDPIALDYSPKICHESYETWLLKQESCDILLTDPPYSTDIEDIISFSKTWLPMALEKVKPTGRAYIFIGAYPIEVQAYLRIDAPEWLILRDILVWEYRNTIGPTPKSDYFLNWQAILYYKGKSAPDWDDEKIVDLFAVQNINAPDGRTGNRYHTWEKPLDLAEKFIRQATKEGDLLIDPFAGTGTFLLAAHKLGRRAIGCEISMEMLELAKLRGCSIE